MRFRAFGARRDESSTQAESSQSGVLNGQRFILALVVLTGHISSFVDGPLDWTHVGLWLNQGSAVFGFFVIDGFICADRLVQRPSEFTGWRFYRIYPIFLANLLLVLAAYVAMGSEFRYPHGQLMRLPTGLEVMGTLFMTQQFLTLVVPLNGQTWSVACYWWLGVLGSRLGKLQTPCLFAIAAGSYTLFLVFQHENPTGMQDWTYGRAFLGVAWIWLCGFMWFRLKNTPLGVFFVLFPAAIAAAAGYFIGVPLLMTLLILILSERVRLPATVVATLVWLGDLAYPLYLNHTAVVAFLCYEKITNSTILTAASLLVSVLMVYLIDYPARRWLSRPLARRAGAALLNR